MTFLIKSTRTLLTFFCLVSTIKGNEAVERELIQDSFHIQKMSTDFVSSKNSTNLPSEPTNASTTPTYPSTANQTVKPTSTPTTLKPTSYPPANQTDEPTNAPTTLDPTTLPPSNQTDVPTTLETTRPPIHESTTKSPEGEKKECKGNGVWSNVAGMDEWCDTNCNAIVPYCPPSHCVCN